MVTDAQLCSVPGGVYYCTYIHTFIKTCTVCTYCMCVYTYICTYVHIRMLTVQMYICTCTYVRRCRLQALLGGKYCRVYIRMSGICFSDIINTSDTSNHLMHSLTFNGTAAVPCVEIKCMNSPLHISICVSRHAHVHT